MKLYRLSKAGKPGLIAVQKPVTKNGKTFMQTFYVKPADKPKPVEKKIDLNEPFADPKNPQATRNRPEGGFWITVLPSDKERDKWHTDTGLPGSDLTQVAMKVPASQIKSIHTHAGYTFVLHRMHDASTKTWGPGWVMSEISTGMKAGPEGTPGEVIQRFEDHVVAKYDHDKLTGVVNQNQKITGRIKSENDSEAWLENRAANATEMTDAVNTLYEHYSKEWKHPVMSMPFGRLDLKAFIDMGWGTKIDKLSLDKLVAEPLSLRVVHAGIVLGADPGDAETAVDNVDAIIERYEDLMAPKSGPYMWKNVTDWAARFEVGIEDAYWEMDDYTVFTDDYDSAYGQEGATIIVNAYASDSDPQQVKNEMQAAADEERRNDEMEAHDAVWTNPNTNIEWASNEFFALGQWIKNSNSSVSKARSLGKEYDKLRLAGQTALPVTDPIVSVLHNKAVGYTETEMLFRGTKNKAWRELEPGDTMEFSMGSFSKSRFKAHEFGTWQGEPTVLEMKVNPDEMQNPVMAVDVDEMIYTAEDDGMQMNALVDASGLNTHATEKEVIVRAPTLKILEVEHREAGSDPLVAHSYWRIAVEPADMNLIAMAKALFAERDDIIEGAERTFDYPLHDEPDWENL